MELKYKDRIVAIDGCPPSDAKPCQRTAYRFVFADLADERCFLPVAILTPQRKFDDEYACCLSHSLSMFGSRDRAIRKYRNLRMKYKNIHKTIGTHLAEGELSLADGIATPFDPKTHFSFFEAADSDMSSCFAIAEVLCDD